MIIVSACLAGVNCKYNGENNENAYISKLVRDGKAIALCPEVLGGLEIPRKCCEIVEDEEGRQKVINVDGKDLTKEFIKGAEKTLQIAQIVGAEIAILQARSPSCGYGMVYDGTFSGKLIAGNGFTTQLLLKKGIKVYSEKEFEVNIGS